MICPHCGNQILEWAGGVCYVCDRIAKEQRRYGRRSKARKRSTPMPVPEVTPANPIPPVDRIKQRRGINNLLFDIYGKEHLLSMILAAGGFSPEEISLLRTPYLVPFLDILVESWNDWFSQTLPNIRGPIIFRRYSLDGQARPTLRQLGEKYGLSHERIRQLQRNGVRRLGTKKRKARLEHLVCDAARHVLVGAGSPCP